ncbi:MAG: hypothetical protein JWM91_2744 [Rhodospirillales bacterium]|nr:hypothetical protein [Rhodospirillales bacterium]
MAMASMINWWCKASEVLAEHLRENILRGAGGQSAADRARIG